MGTPDLSTVVAVHNGARHLSATLSSLAWQRGAQVEIIVVDDGSTDDSVSLARAHPAQPRVLEQGNLGAAVARNRGLALARSRWVAFVDQDDLWHPDRAAVLLALADETGRLFVGTTEQAFALEEDRGELLAIGDGRETWPSQWVRADQEIEGLTNTDPRGQGSGRVEYFDETDLLRGPLSLTTAFMFDRELAIASGGAATFARALDDHIFYVNLARIAGGLARLDRPYLYYRVHPASATTTSPLAAPYLSSLLALRWGGVHPREAPRSAYLDHLLDQVPSSGLTLLEQAALVALSAPPVRRRRALARWAKLALRARLDSR